MADSAVPETEALVPFADAVILGPIENVESCRALLQERVGHEGVVDAAGVIGNFQRMNRIANAGGLSLDGPAALLSADIRDELKLDTLATGSRGTTPGRLAKSFARFSIPIAKRIYALKK